MRLPIPAVTVSGIFLVMTLSVFLPNIKLPNRPNNVYNINIVPIVKFNTVGKYFGCFIFACKLGICVMLSIANVLIPHMITNPLTSNDGNFCGNAGRLDLLKPNEKIKIIPININPNPAAATGNKFFNVFTKLNTSNIGNINNTTTTLENVSAGKTDECKLFVIIKPN